MKEIQTLKVIEVKVSKLKPWRDNPRVNDHADEAVATSIRAFGFNVPILCDEGRAIIAGHARWKAAVKLGMATVPVIVLPMTESQRKAFAVADNKTAEIADWDFPKLRELLEELRSEDVDLVSVGYSDAELRALLEPEKDFDWEAFDAERAVVPLSEYALFPVKVPRKLKAQMQSAVDKYGKTHGLTDKDRAIKAGQILALLLRVSNERSASEQGRRNGAPNP